MTKYLTNREAAQAILDGKKLLHAGAPDDGQYIEMWDLSGISAYHMSPQTITRTITYPKPFTGHLTIGVKYFYPGLCGEAYSYCWYPDAIICLDHQKNGLVHLTEEAAIAHAKALIGGAE